MASMLTILEVVQRSAAYLSGKGVENARLNAEWLIAAALGVNRMRLYMQFDRPLGEAELSGMRGLVARRGKREPLQYILGTAPFHELTLKVDKRALIPRPETEQLVGRVVDFIKDASSPLRVLDLGTGSGAIALALAYALPQAELVAIDRSEEALALAAENAVACGLQDRVEFRRSDWFSAIETDERFDLIVSNPPYLSKEEVDTAEPEVAMHEPLSALLAGEAGLADLHRILEGSCSRLCPGGRIWLETGVDHHASLLQRCSDLGFSSAEGLEDWSGRPRFVRAMR